jgi:hypothetical protein
LSSELETECIDLWCGQFAISIDDLHDGLHLGPGILLPHLLHIDFEFETFLSFFFANILEGNIKLFESIRSIIEKYPELTPSISEEMIVGIPLHFPHHSKLGGRTIDESKAVLEKWNWT